MTEPILYEKRNQSAWIYLNRPEEMNAISKELLRALEEAVIRAEHDEDVRVVIVSGKGKAFCAGADLKELLEDIETQDSLEPGLLDLVGSVFGKLEKLSKPLIAALNGITVAGGLEIAMTADIVIASQKARIGDGHANFGVIPGGGGAVKLPRKIGINRAKYLLFTGDFLSADDMKDFGLVQEVVPPENLEAAVQDTADKISAKSPLVLRKMKELVADGMEQPLEIALKQELLSLREHTKSHDLTEGLSAFAEKRRPAFRGY
ncbi:enoyl-CoA hydratase/isomerase family protein [Bhargavaea ullalensis]|uniref:Enoyl-CoA hydratase/carnithine racemase n=1 Tax=Bhargavaea ullalensis TaxID=1265685 RepID=A0ABV2GCZ1_9BACL